MPLLRGHDNDVSVCVENMQNNRSTFIVEGKREHRAVIHAGRVIASMRKKMTVESTDVSRSSIVSLIANVKKSFTKYIMKNNIDIEIVPQRFSATYRNGLVYSDLAVGQEFYLIDLAHAYWRIAYIMGVISKRLYDSIKDNVQLKTFRNMSLACVKAPKWRIYYVGGREWHRITEANEIYNLVYKNIRYTCYNTMGDIKTQLGNECLFYRVDGIGVMPDYLDAVIDAMNHYQMLYTIVKCTKASNSSYTTDKGETKKF
jgi:hypothetical protein